MLKKLNVIERDDRVRDYILPARIMSVDGEVTNAETLLIKKDLQIALEDHDVAIFKGESSVVLDYGKEIQGGIRILTHALEGDCKVRIRFGESLSEVYTTPNDVMPGSTATNDHSLRDFTTNLRFLSDMCFGQTGFRFIKIDFDCDAVYIKNIIGVFEHRNLKRLGAFECSDSRINEIFDTAVYTVELCMQNMLWDGIKRDRLVWIGDLHPEMLTITSIFSEDKSIEDALVFSAKSAPIPGWINTMPAYSLWWLIVAGDYYFHTNKQSFLNENKAYIVALMQRLDEVVDAQGNIDFPTFFLDWVTNTTEEAKAGVYALFDIAMKKGKILLTALGEDTKVCEGILARLNKNLSGGEYKQVIALKALAGHFDKQTASKKLLEGGAKGVSSFMSYYILSVIANGGYYAEALDIMRTYYGGMLDMGATTFWEDFDIEWMDNSCKIDELKKEGQKDIHGDFGRFCYLGFRHSLCHGWSSGCVPFLFRYIAGVTELEPGCKKIAIKPNLCGLDYIKCAYPTPYGNIEISVKNEHGKAELNYKAPKEIEIVI